MIIQMIVLPTILSAYKRSLRIGSAGKTAPINRFFVERIKGSKRLKEFYPNGLTILTESGTRHLSLKALLDHNICINGRNFGTLKEIEEKAVALLDTSNFVDTWEICGLGDGHLGNILLSKEKGMNQEYNVLMVDYEISGYHSPFLDLVKPYYVDVFFAIFFADILSVDNLLQKGLISRLSVDNNCITIDLDINSFLSPHALFVRKMNWKGLINPFKKLLSSRLRGDLFMRKQIDTLGAALFANSIYSRNFSGRSDVFLANLALGILLFLEGVHQV